MRLLKTHFLLLTCLAIATGVGANNSPIRQLAFTSLDELWAQLSPAAYLEQVDIRSIKDLEADRFFLDSLSLSGDDFVFQLGETYLAKHPVNLDSSDLLYSQLEVAGLMMHSTHYLPDSVWVYAAVGDFLFDKITSQFQVYIDDEVWQPNEYRTRRLLDELARYQYFPNQPVSNTSKAWRHFREGDWSYLWYKATHDYWKEALGLVLFGLVGLYILFVLIRRWRRGRPQNLPDAE